MQNTLPIRLSPAPRVHRILTVRGAKDAARSRVGRQGELNRYQPTAWELCADAPFRLGCFDSSNRMFHVFDENALDAVLTTLDTASDFITYLCRREALLRRPYQVTASSEENLLGLYMLNFDADRDQVDFPNAPHGQAMFVDEKITGMPGTPALSAPPGMQPTQSAMPGMS